MEQDQPADNQPHAAQQAKSGKQENACQRRCIVTGDIRPKAELIRFVLSPDGQVTPDLKATLPGRGVWVSASRSVLQQAMKRKQFNRAFAKKLIVDSNLDQLVDQLLEKAALGRLKMANKAGQAVYGFAKVMDALEKRRIISLIHAYEASPDEAGKLDYKFRTNLEQSGNLGVTGGKNPFNCFKTEELSLAFGAANVIHAGLKDGGAGLAAVSAMEKLIAYRK